MCPWTLPPTSIPLTEMEASEISFLDVSCSEAGIMLIPIHFVVSHSQNMFFLFTEAVD
jgi:hypothetical protein